MEEAKQIFEAIKIAVSAIEIVEPNVPRQLIVPRWLLDKMVVAMGIHNESEECKKFRRAVNEYFKDTVI